MPASTAAAALPVVPVRWVRRALLLVCGPVALAVGAACAIVASDVVGAGSYQALEAGMVATTGWPVGTVVFVEAAAALAVGVALGGRPRPATVYLLAALGPLVGRMLPLVPEPSGVTAALGLAAVGAVGIGAGVGTYLAAGWGASPHDLPLATLRARGVRPGVAKAGLDVVLVAAGWALGVRPGLGALVPLVVVGPVLSAVLVRAERWAGTADPVQDMPG